MESLSKLPPAARTLLIPLMYRAMESLRADAIVRDDRAAEMLARFNGELPASVRRLGMEQTATMFRARKFDSYVHTFLRENPNGTVVDLGCGLDTRFGRIDNGACRWLGVDFPEVIRIRTELLPPLPRETLLASALNDYSWMEAIASDRKPILFLAEGVFPYLRKEEVVSLLETIARKFPGSELVCDVLNRFSAWIHQFHPGIRKSRARLERGIDSAKDLMEWIPGICILEEWNYFEQKEPRLRLYNWMRWFPLLGKSNFLIHLRMTG